MSQRVRNRIAAAHLATARFIEDHPSPTLEDVRPLLQLMKRALELERRFGFRPLFLSEISELEAIIKRAERPAACEEIEDQCL